MSYSSIDGHLNSQGATIDTARNGLKMTLNEQAAAPSVSAEPGLELIASFSIPGDMASEIGGEQVSVTTAALGS